MEELSHLFSGEGPSTPRGKIRLFETGGAPWPPVPPRNRKTPFFIAV